MRFYSIGKFAKIIGKSEQTLRNWDKEDRLKPHHVTDSGYRYYSQDQVNHYLGMANIEPKNRLTIGYCRVSSHKQKDDLERQIENMEDYLKMRGYNYRIIKDIGSGINYNKKGLNKIIEMVIHHEVERVVILYKDRLVRFGYELIENLFKHYQVEIEVIDNTEKTEEQELVEDLIQIVTVFSCRLQGKRANQAKKLIKELKENDEVSEG